MIVRFILISIVVYLLVRSFARYFHEQNMRDHRHRSDYSNRQKQSGVSKEIGEYVDYEEID